ncbi:hypothetical protein HYC85_000422 [Camellia sinensis]|uniref:Expansin-like EG45 domain-containing protein n=1 Tax=Camellia sinensis TaxID=4442 RepID=A0A7J7I2F7_CAMSI|nr:hypothetical protein HYC85_000422 [Camellia sinensis]
MSKGTSAQNRSSSSPESALEIKKYIYCKRYQPTVKCNSNPACLGNPKTVTITNRYPGTCGPLQFDLSGVAFGAMAIFGKADVLCHTGRLQIEYQRVQCHYPGVTVAFHVDEKSNPYYFATAVVYEGGDGNLAGVELQNSGKWLPMQHSWGAVWKLNSVS